MGKSVKKDFVNFRLAKYYAGKNKMMSILIGKVEAKPMDVLVLRTSFFMVNEELHKHRII